MLRPHDFRTVAKWLVDGEKLGNSFKNPPNFGSCAAAPIRPRVFLSFGTNLIEGVSDVASFDYYGVFPRKETALRAVNVLICNLDKAEKV
jgi:hypothetical protein